MSCDEYREWISVDLDGELSAEEAVQLREHLAHCGQCRQVKEDFKLNRILLTAMEPRTAPADAFERLGTRLSVQGTRCAPPAPRRSSRRAQQAKVPVSFSPARRRFTLGRVLRAAAVFAILFIGMLTWLGLTAPDTDAQTPALKPARPAVHQVSVAPVALMRGHAMLQATNPVADASAWHYLASEDDARSSEQAPSDAGQGM